MCLVKSQKQVMHILEFARKQKNSVMEQTLKRNLMKFNKSKYRALHLGRNNPKYHQGLGAHLLESSSAFWGMTT